MCSLCWLAARSRHVPLFLRPFPVVARVAEIDSSLFESIRSNRSVKTLSGSGRLGLCLVLVVPRCTSEITCLAHVGRVTCLVAAPTSGGSLRLNHTDGIPEREDGRTRKVGEDQPGLLSTI